MSSIEQVREVLQELAGEPMTIRAVRGEKTFQTTAAAAKCSEDGAYKLGA